MKGLICLVWISAVGMAAGPLWPIAAFAQDGDGEGQNFEQVRDQGVLYFKRNRFKQAMGQFNKAYKLKGGHEDFTTVFYRGQTAHKLLLLEIAFEMAQKAKELAADDARKKGKAEALIQEMASLYGAATVKPAKEETNRKGRIFLEAKTRIINREKKRQFKAIRLRFRSNDIEVPTTIYLPYGSYLANNVPFELEPGDASPTVEVFLQIVQKDEGIPWYWWVSAGGAVVGGVVLAVFFASGGEETKTEPRLQIEIKNLREQP